MKSNRAAQSSVDISNLSVPDAEEIIEEALSELAFSPGSRAGARPAVSGAPRLPGHCRTVQRKRAQQAAKRPGRQLVSGRGRGSHLLRAPRRRHGAHRPEPRIPSPDRRRVSTTRPRMTAAVPADLDARVKELCAALAEAERGGHAFIALKWFRDSFLPRKAFRWNQHPESRQAVLAEAIQRGVVLTSKIANPKTPGLSDDDHSPEPRRSRRPRRGPALPSGRRAGRVDQRSHRRGTRKAVSCYFLESTAFAKLFVQEPGTDALIRLMESVEDNRKLIAASAPLEVYAAIRRRETGRGYQLRRRRCRASRFCALRRPAWCRSR